MLEKDGNVTFSRFRLGEGSCIGQYPDPNTDKDKNIDYGGYATVPVEY
ncbi:MAG: hypothetical protein IJ746_02180 [Ruminococcus sp.]|nr:hypothetical protein [Ruminococcus sp.]